VSRIKYVAFFSLLVLILIAAFSFSTNREPKNTFTPVPFTANPAPSTKANQTAEIKGEPGKPQTIDIFSGKPVSKSVYTDFNGERIYFCCDVERKEFLKNPELIMKRIKDRGIILDTVPKS